MAIVVAQDPPTMQPHEGHCRLLSVLHGQMLEDQRTGERVFFDEDDGVVWRLVFDGGVGFLTNGEEAMWLCDVLDISFHKNTEGREFVRFKGVEGSRWYHEWYHECSAHRVGIASEDGLQRHLRYYKFARLQDGAYLFWSLPSVQDAMGLTGRKHGASRWIHNMWKDWCWFIEKMRLPHSHMRKSANFRHSQNEPNRFLHEQTCSTAALLALLSHWSHSSHIQEIKKGAEGVLKGLVRRALGDLEADVMVHMDKSYDGCPGVTISGRNMRKIRITDGFVEMAPMLTEQSPLDEQVSDLFMTFVTPVGYRVPCHNLLIIGDKGGEKWRWWQRQLVMQIATLLEEDLDHWSATASASSIVPFHRAERDVADALALGRALPGPMVAPGEAGAIVVAEPPKKRMRNAVQYHQSLRQQGKGPKGEHFVSQHIQRMLCRYWLAGRRHMRFCYSVVLAVDASNIGGKETLLSIIFGRRVDSEEWIGMHGPPQDLPATKLVKPDGEEEKAKAASSWTACATAYLTKEKAPVTETKIKRLASKHWLAAVDHLLVSVSVGGLHTYRTPTDYTKDLFGEMLQGEVAKTFNDLEHPCLVVVIDQGSVGWSPSFYTMYQLHLRYTVVYDILHRVWNSLKNAFVSAGFWEVALLFGLHASVNYGPFDGAQFGEEVKAAALHHQQTSDSSCPLFSHLLPRIAMDRGEEGRLHDEEWISEVWDESLRHPKLQQKGPKMALARWMSVIDVISWWDEVFHMRLLRLLYLGIQMGYIGGDLARCRFQIASPASASTGSLASSTRNTKVNVNKTRDQCRNSLHLATMVFLEPSLQRSGRVMLRITDGIRLFHGMNAKFLRSHADNIKWHSDMATGKILPVLAKSFLALRSIESLAYMGFTTTLCSADARRLTVNDPVVLEEDEWASKAANLALQCASHLLRASLTWMDSYPGAFAGLLHESEEVREQCLGKAKSDWLAYVAAAKQEYTPIKNMAKQSFFQQAHVLECFYMLVREKFERVPNDLKRRLELNFCMAGTQAIEHNFREERVSENRDNENKTVGSTRKWAVPIQREVLTRKHHYTEIVWEDQELDPQLLPENMGKLFDPPQVDRAMSMPLPGLVSDKNPEWPTFAPARVAVQSAEMAVFREYKLNGNWHQSRFLWLSCLCRPGMMMRKVGTQVWFMSLGNYHSTAVAALPVEEVQLLGQKYLHPKFPERWSNVYWHVVDDIDLWEVLPTEWRSPVHDMLETDSLQTPRGIWARQIAPVRPLIQDSAHHGFDSLPMTTLRELAKNVRCSVPVGSDLYQMMELLIKHILPGLEDEKLSEIMARRIWKPKLVDPEFFEMQGVKECFDEGDQDEVEKYVKGEKNKVDAKFHQSYKKLVEKVRAASGRIAPGPAATSSSSSSSSAAPSRRRPAPPTAGGEDYTQDEAQLFLPDGARLSKDLSNGRWLVVHPPFGTRSRSFQLYGSVKALALCLQWAWANEEKKTGEACPFDWVAAEIARQ